MNLVAIIIMPVLGYYWNNFLNNIWPSNPDGSANDAFKYWFFKFLGWGVLIVVAYLILRQLNS